MRRIALVTRREVVAGLTKKPFIIATAIMLVLIVAGAFVADYFASQTAEETAVRTIGVTEDVAELAPLIRASGEALGVTIETEDVAGRTAAETALADESIDAFLSGSTDDLHLLFQSATIVAITQAVTSAAQTQALSGEITSLGGDPALVARAVQGATPTISFVEDPAAIEGPQYFVAMISVALLFFALINSGSQIAIGVVEEKSSRVVEILLATLRPSQLFAGKVIGNGIVGLLQVLLYALAFLLVAAVTGALAELEVNLGSQFAWLLVWFLLGFALYAVLWGSLASLVSRQEDIGTITAPVTILMLVPFYTAVFMVPTNPDGAAVRVLSQIPFFAPFMMPMRTGFSTVPLWELITAVAFCLVAIPLLVWLAAKVYHRGVLHTGARLTVREALTRRA
ncbi:MAG: ABC transporter permease [Actinomycetales bacterium]|nr:ABC transporter permease [Actinomycetales bacterium]